MKLYLIRHAQSGNNAIWNGSGHAGGRTPDPEITGVGHRQAELLGCHFAEPGNEPRQHPKEPPDNPHYDLNHLYCSLMSRSLLTAQYVARACNVNLKALGDVYERKGVYKLDRHGREIGVAGPNRNYFQERFPEVSLPDDFNQEGWWNRPVETDLEFFQRVEASLRNIVDRHGQCDDRVAIVAHGDYIDQCINELMGVDRKPHNYQEAWVANWVFHNTSISRIDIIDGSCNVVYLNRIDHLPHHLVTW